MSAQRMVFFTLAVFILIGIGLTGFDRVHWFLYLPVAALALAGATGICPSMLFWKKLGFK